MVLVMNHAPSFDSQNFACYNPNKVLVMEFATIPNPNERQAWRAANCGVGCGDGPKTVLAPPIIALASGPSTNQYEIDGLFCDESYNEERLTPAQEKARDRKLFEWQYAREREELYGVSDNSDDDSDTELRLWTGAFEERGMPHTRVFCHVT